MEAMKAENAKLKEQIEALKVAKENQKLREQIQGMKERLAETEKQMQQESAKGEEEDKPAAAAEEEPAAAEEEKQEEEKAGEPEPEKPEPPKPTEPPFPPEKVLGGVGLVDAAGTCLHPSPESKAGGLEYKDHGGEYFEAAGCATWSVERRWKTVPEGGGEYAVVEEATGLCLEIGAEGPKTRACEEGVASMSFAAEGPDPLRFCTMSGRICVAVMATTTTTTTTTTTAAATQGPPPNTTTTTTTTMDPELQFCLGAIESCLAEEGFERKCVEEQVPRQTPAPPGVSRTKWDYYAGSCCPAVGKARQECLKRAKEDHFPYDCNGIWRKWAEKVEEVEEFPLFALCPDLSRGIFACDREAGPAMGDAATCDKLPICPPVSKPFPCGAWGCC